MKRYLIPALALVSIGAFSALADSDSGMRWFDRLDTNKDGVISRDEYNAYRAARFAKMDTNGDGVISLEEFNAQAEARFTSADTDGNGEISKDEFAAAKERWRKTHEQAE